MAMIACFTHAAEVPDCLDLVGVFHRSGHILLALRDEEVGLHERRAVHHLDEPGREEAGGERFVSRAREGCLHSGRPVCTFEKRQATGIDPW